ncbi:hypothetical protein [Arthrobacter sp. S39]|nr:hypothetical protein [Arthrobacter sp. S39]
MPSPAQAGPGIAGVRAFGAAETVLCVTRSLMFDGGAAYLRGR